MAHSLLPHELAVLRDPKERDAQLTLLNVVFSTDFQRFDVVVRVCRPEPPGPVQGLVKAGSRLSVDAFVEEEGRRRYCFASVPRSGLDQKGACTEPETVRCIFPVPDV